MMSRKKCQMWHFCKPDEDNGKPMMQRVSKEPEESPCQTICILKLMSSQ